MGHTVSVASTQLNKGSQRLHVNEQAGCVLIKLYLQKNGLLAAFALVSLLVLVLKIKV